MQCACLLTGKSSKGFSCQTQTEMINLASQIESLWGLMSKVKSNKLRSIVSLLPDHDWPIFSLRFGALISSRRLACQQFYRWRQLKSLSPLKCEAEQGKTKQIMEKRSDCSSGFPLCSCESGELRFVTRWFPVVCSGGFKKDLLWWEKNLSR